jgi:LysR family transcriptional regulator of gallate degradation
MQFARTELSALVEKGSVRNAAIFGMLTHERRVRAFIALTEQHHMPSVAESLGITQPAVSIAVRQLEDSIGVALFERTARGMMPTPAGTALALRLKRALAEIRHAVADIASLRGVTQGTVTVGALPLAHAAAPGVDRQRRGPISWTARRRWRGRSRRCRHLRAGDVDFILGALRSAEHASDLQGACLRTTSWPSSAGTASGPAASELRL